MPKLDLCCGPSKPDGYVGIDIIPFKGVDYVLDLNHASIPCPSETYDEIRAHDAIEHISDGMQLMKDIWRALKPNGLVDVLVPSTDGRGAWQDMTHKSYWNINSFKYWINPAPFLDYYRGCILFENVELYNTPISDDGVIHVVWKAKAIKTQTWLDLYYKRNTQ
jgi:SAM-dependent methyltransferase